MAALSRLLSRLPSHNYRHLRNPWRGVVDVGCSLDSAKSLEASYTTFVAISLPLAVILPYSQLFKYSICLIFVLPNNMWSHEIVCRVPEKICSASADINGIDNILIAI